VAEAQDGEGAAAAGGVQAGGERQELDRNAGVGGGELGEVVQLVTGHGGFADLLAQGCRSQDDGDLGRPGDEDGPLPGQGGGDGPGLDCGRHGAAVRRLGAGVVAADVWTGTADRKRFAATLNALTARGSEDGAYESAVAQLRDALTSESKEDLKNSGEYAAARDQDTLDRYRRVLDADHPRTVASARSLAEGLRLLGGRSQ